MAACEADANASPPETLPQRTSAKSLPSMVRKTSEPLALASVVALAGVMERTDACA